jgi:hypothetical protein
MREWEETIILCPELLEISEMYQISQIQVSIEKCPNWLGMVANTYKTSYSRGEERRTSVQG